jgi:hypothetical protein
MENELNTILKALNESLHSQDFVLKTQQQLAKDFRQHGFEFGDFFEKDSLNLQELIPLVSNQLAEIIENHPSKWLPLIYTLDISEKKYHTFLQKTNLDWLNEFAFVVIQREAQKVFFREKFK